MWYNKKIILAEEYTTAMIAFFIPADVVKKIKIKKNILKENESEIEKQSNIHLTLMLLVDRKSIENKKDTIMKAIKQFANKNKVMSGNISGVGLFAGQKKNDKRPLYASFDGPKLPEFRQNLFELIDDIKGVKIAQDHGYTPHITLAYLDPKEEIPQLDVELIPVEFKEITLMWGDERHDFALGDSD